MQITAATTQTLDRFQKIRKDKYLKCFKYIQVVIPSEDTITAQSFNLKKNIYMYAVYIYSNL